MNIGMKYRFMSSFSFLLWIVIISLHLLNKIEHLIPNTIQQWYFDCLFCRCQSHGSRLNTLLNTYLIKLIHATYEFWLKNKSSSFWSIINNIVEYRFGQQHPLVSSLSWFASRIFVCSFINSIVEHIFTQQYLFFSLF